MIAQIWRGLTRADDRHDFTSLLQARMQAELAASNECLGAYVLQRQMESSQVESLVLTLYDREPLVNAGRSDKPDPPPLVSAKEARLLLGGDPAPAQYEVIIDPQRALLYAELRRRFPLRFAAVR